MKNPKIELQDEVYEIFLATRVIHCQALSCRFHMLNFDKFGEIGACTLKRVYITEEAKCQQYEAKPSD